MRETYFINIYQLHKYANLLYNHMSCDNIFLIQNFTYRNEIANSDVVEDFVNGRVWGQGAIEDVELPLETLGYVISTPTRVYHRAHHLDVNNCRELSWFLEVEEATDLHHLACDLIGHLCRNMLRCYWQLFVSLFFLKL